MIGNRKLVEVGLRLGLAVRPFQWRLLGSDVVLLVSFQLGSTFGVELNIAGPLSRRVGFSKDSLHGTFRYTGFTINAVDGIDVEHLLILPEALHGANDDAIGVFAIVATGSNYVSHGILFLKPTTIHRLLQDDSCVLRESVATLAGIVYFSSSIDDISFSSSVINARMTELSRYKDAARLCGNSFCSLSKVGCSLPV